MHQQRLHRIAWTVALRLGVVRDAHGHVDVGVLVDEDVANAVEVLDHRDLRLACDPFDQAFATARHDHVDVLFIRDEEADGSAIDRGDHLDRGFRQAGCGQAFAHAGGNGLVAVQCLRPAAQDAGVAGLEAQRRGVGGHVRPRFVDDADDAERHAHLADLNAGRPVPQLADLADGVAQRRDLFEAFRHRCDRS